jgi:hypothetical protein
MLTLITAALVAAQPAPAPNPHAQHAPTQHDQMTPAQHEGMKKDCCKDCCKDMAKHDEHAPAKPQRAQ